MSEPEIIDKVINYLNKENFNYIKETISYLGMREKSPQFNGTKKDVHIVAFQVDIDKDNPYAIDNYFIFIDKKTEKLLYIIGSQFYKTIEE